MVNSNELRHIKVVARENEPLDALLKRFKKTVMDMRVIEECRKREFYLKKSLRRKEKSKRARIRAIRGN